MARPGETECTNVGAKRRRRRTPGGASNIAGKDSITGQPIPTQIAEGDLPELISEDSASTCVPPASLDSGPLISILPVELAIGSLCTVLTGAPLQ